MPITRLALAKLFLNLAILAVPDGYSRIHAQLLVARAVIKQTQKEYKA